MKYIRENDKYNDEQLRIQTNFLLDQLVKYRDYINNRIQEVFGYDVHSLRIENPCPCNISVYTDEENTDIKASSFDISDPNNLSKLRDYGKILTNIDGRCEIDFIITYSIKIKGSIKKSDNIDKSIDEILNGYETMGKDMSDIVNKLRRFKEDLGDLQIHTLYKIDLSDRTNEYNVMFQLRRKNRIVIDPLRYIKKINNFE